MKKGLFHTPVITWSKFNSMSNLQRWLCCVRVEKPAAEKIGRLFFFYAMSARGAKVETVKDRLLSVWERASKNGPTA